MKLLNSLALLILAPQAMAEFVYVSQGEFGETSFSDVVLPGAEYVELQVAEPSPAEVLALHRQTQVTADLVTDLADARRARSAARAQQRASARAQAMASAVPAEQRTEEPDRYGYPYYPRPFLHRPGIGPGGHHPRRPLPASPVATPEEMAPSFKSKWITGSSGR